MKDQLILSFRNEGKTSNLCAATDKDFENALNAITTIEDVHVRREELLTLGGLSGYTWSVTFSSHYGDVPLLIVELSEVGVGKDASGETGNDALYVMEFLKGQGNEFVIEPKKSTGAVVRDIEVSSD
jgi:hypothetical protein